MKMDRLICNFSVLSADGHDQTKWFGCVEVGIAPTNNNPEDI